jgi:hypothetical protein
LRGSRVDKRLLESVKMFSVRDTFDGRDVGSVGVQQRHEAAVHEASVDQHGARAALAFAASLLRACQTQIDSQRVKQAHHRMSAQLDVGAVHAKSDRSRHVRLRPYRAAASTLPA